MRLTNAQKSEIDFLCKTWEVTPTEEEVKEYIATSVHGQGSGKVESGNTTKNPLLQAKRHLDINIKMWTEDIAKGYLGYSELIEDFNHPYATKVVNGIMAGLKARKGFNIAETAVVFGSIAEYEEFLAE